MFILLLFINNIVIYFIIENNNQISLEIPEVTIDVDKAEVTWNKVDYADGYYIYINNLLYGSTNENSYFIEIDDYMQSHIIQIEAYSVNEKYKASLSKPIIYQVKNKVATFVSPYKTNLNGDIVGNAKIDIFNNAFFELKFDFSGHYKFQLKYSDSDITLNNFIINNVSNDRYITKSQIEGNWYKVYLEAGNIYQIELKDLNNEYKYVELIFTTFYDTELFDEFNLSLQPNQDEIIKVSYEEAKDIIFRTKEYNNGIYFKVYESLYEFGNISSGMYDHIAMINKNAISYNSKKEFYLIIHYVKKEAIDIIIENIDLEELNINLNENIIVDDSYSVKIYKFTNTELSSPIYIEYFGKNVCWKNIYNSSFGSINCSQYVKSNGGSVLYVINYLPFNEECYLVIVPDKDEIIGNDNFVVSGIRPNGW